jgi:Di-haem cytochrome c peroxidase
MTRATRLSAALLSAAALLAIAIGAAEADPRGEGGVLPAGSDIDYDSLYRPREVFRSEAIHGRKPYLVVLGDIAFGAPSLLGGAARQAGISCSTCHVEGTNNPGLYIAGLSSRGGNFDTTNALFNAKADNGVFDPVAIPSLRGARLFGPYGHDGRMASLRDFVRQVIVVEFAGAEPAPEILDALVAYIQDIDILPNRRLGQAGELLAPVSDAEKRGAALFAKPFPHDANLSCAACHKPAAGFADHVQHDVGTSGFFKTPTLLNANVNAPYFHDGRYRNYGEVVAHFDRVFYLGLTAAERADLVAYLQAIGGADEPFVTDSIELRLAEIDDFTGALDTAIPDHDATAVALTVDAVSEDLRELGESFPERKDTTVAGGIEERRAARGAVRGLVLGLHRIGAAASDGQFDKAEAALADYRAGRAAALPLLKAAEAWSLFNPEVHDRRRLALRQVTKAGIDPRLAARPRLDND